MTFLTTFKRSGQSNDLQSRKSSDIGLLRELTSRILHTLTSSLSLACRKPSSSVLIVVVSRLLRFGRKIPASQLLGDAMRKSCGSDL
ncbi:hypothetical protein Agabi119p4_4979 [Agaricus bisporus var. burnettii]|uniref:Uncharacterized protein n=1 Tax=Agaricus bisporus var. burnettii TaxID=192524 RepID=A0A8H7F4A1_AGABI|nr:hypothetical protein Agabi119p4_4979 [Agaricus bisporus var. burnettii]